MADFEGPVRISGYLVFDATPAAPLSPSGKAHLWWDQANSLWKISENGGAYRSLIAHGGGEVLQADLAAASLDGTIAKVVAAANVIGGLEVLHRIDIAAGALADTDVVLTHKTRVTDAWLVLRGAGVVSTTLQVKNGATAITDAMAASGADQAIVRAASIDDAAWEIAAAGTLRVTSATGATQPAATVFVRGIRVT